VNRATQDARGDRRRRQDSPPRRTSPAQSADSPSDYAEGAEPPPTGQYRPGGRRPVRQAEDRYRQGGRRTGAEPLSASWRPIEEHSGENPFGHPIKAPAKRDKKLSKTYGWRLYALPILLVLTALVVFKTATSPPEPVPGQQNSAVGGDASGDAPAERPAGPVNLNIPTADLPPGGSPSTAGTGEYHVIPVPAGSGKVAGNSGKLYTYTIDVENGIDASSFAGEDTFANSVESTLSDSRSWIGTGKVRLQRVDGRSQQPDFRVSLTTLNTTKRPDVCGFDIPYPTSCYRTGFDHRVVINLSRWVNGATAFGSDMGLYRQYAINHEVGHALGNTHVGCQENGGLAPVMMQQTFGVSNDYVAQLNQVDLYNSKAVPADGKVCRPNAWPNLAGGDTNPK
jgi:hypothetical protein